jgi:glycosyltransferase involved in cell wall biosynthesis
MKRSFKQPTISIVIPLYNKEREVARSLKSVLLQTFAYFELIVVNDGSTDRGPDIVKSTNDPRIRIIDQPNAGVSAARNRGISEAQADLIAFLDADDEWYPDFLEAIIRLRNKFPSCDVFATNYSFRRANNYGRSTIVRGLSKEFREGILTDYFKIASQSDPPLCSSAIAVTKKAIQLVGGFPIGVTAGEDLLTWARLAVKYDISYSVEPKAYHWEPVEFSGRAGRVFNVPDIVGQELQCLSKTLNGTKSKGLKDYIALWHRMRASSYLRLGQRVSAIKEIQKAVSFSKLNLKLLMYVVLALLPKSLCKGLFRFKKRMAALTRQTAKVI